MSFLQQAITEILCCPRCRGDLKLFHVDELRCLSCFFKYQIRDGILVLTVNKKEQIDELKLREEVARGHEGVESEEIMEVVSLHHCIRVMSKIAKDFRVKFDSSQWVLDIGCGTGWYWRDTEGGKLILMDFAFRNLKAAKILLREQKQILFVQANAANQPIKTSSLSGIWSVQATQHFPDAVFKQFLGELRRVLKNKFLVEIYNFNPALLYRIIYKAFGKKLHIKGKQGEIILNRLNADELTDLWKDIAKNAKFEIGYSELFFHPALHLRPRDRYPVIIEGVLRKVPWMARIFARQIHIKISSQL